MVTLQLTNQHNTTMPGQNMMSSGVGKLPGLGKEQAAALGFLRIGQAWHTNTQGMCSKGGKLTSESACMCNHVPDHLCLPVHASQPCKLHSLCCEACNDLSTSRTDRKRCGQIKAVGISCSWIHASVCQQRVTTVSMNAVSQGCSLRACTCMTFSRQTWALNSLINRDLVACARKRCLHAGTLLGIQPIDRLVEGM